MPFENNVAVPDQKRAWQVFEQWDKPHRTLKGGHFIQENDPLGFVEAILEVAGK